MVARPAVPADTPGPCCADCRQPAFKLYYYVNRWVCGYCRWGNEGVANPVSDAADNPRLGQAAGINAMRREVK